MAIHPIDSLMRFARAFNARDWDDWGRVVGDDFRQSSEHGTEILENDKAGWLEIHKRMAANGMTFWVLSVAVNGPFLCVTWEFRKEDQPLLRGAGVGEVDADGHLIKLKGLNVSV
ncbi:MAG: nuclear transport factor 2 family protein [Acidimicrobiia bacterium]|nr:nuclear transport factor 2 family protein [Acidimicrobiia bacterium]